MTCQGVVRAPVANDAVHVELVRMARRARQLSLSLLKPGALVVHKRSQFFSSVKRISQLCASISWQIKYLRLSVAISCFLSPRPYTVGGIGLNLFAVAGSATAQSSGAHPGFPLDAPVGFHLAYAPVWKLGSISGMPG